MKILFLTIGQIQSLEEKSVHIDLIRALKAVGHEVSVLCTREKRLGLETEFVNEEGINILRLKIGNLTRCSIIEKGVNTLLLERQFVRAIKKYFGNSQFDLVLYNTPPITLAKAVKYCKRKYRCASYLVLKDIFPQNAVDIGILSKQGVKGLLYAVFRRKEKQLYAFSDKIGCMSDANQKYLLEHNPEVAPDKVEICPNAVYCPEEIKRDRSVLEKYGVPSDKVTFIYGGNLGLPQGLPFLVDGIKACREMDCNFVVVGSGQKKQEVFDALKDTPNAYTIDYLPHNEYKLLCASADIGLIMLDYRFTIPNYPSRILTYMENAMPVLACTDEATDVRSLVESEAVCGKWCASNDLDGFVETVKWFLDNRDKFDTLGKSGREYMIEHFNTDICVSRIEQYVKERK